MVFSTILLVLNIIDKKMVSEGQETGLWGNRSIILRPTMILGYFITLLMSYIIFIWTRKAKTRFDVLSNILFLMNGLAVVLLLVVFLTELTKHF